MATSTFRDYALDDCSGGTFSIDTSQTDVAVISAADNHPELAIRAELSRELARELGADLLGFIGSPLTCAAVDYEAVNPAVLCVDVEDGQVEVHVSADGQRSCLALTREQVVDLGQRLIVWAGVATN